MSSAIVGAVSFDELQQGFISDLEEMRAAPGRRFWVVVPTDLLALDLMRAAARALGGVAGVEFLTLRDVARALGAGCLAKKALRPLPEGARELVWERALRDLPDGSYLASFRGFPGSLGAITRAVVLLKNSLWSPEALRQAARRVGNRAEMARRLSELAGLWDYLEQFKRDHRFFDDEDLILEAARAADQPCAPDVVVWYGFYDLTPLQEMLVRTVIGLAGGSRAYLLWAEDDGKPAPGFEYAAPVVNTLRELLGATEVVHLGRQEPGADLSRICGGIFAEIPGGAPGPDAPSEHVPDGSVRIVSCPGEAAEAEQVAREILELVRAQASPLTVGVLMRRTDDVAPELAEVFDRCGVRYYVREGLPLADTTTGRVLLALLELAGGEAERSSVVEFLAVAGRGLPEELPATALDRLSRMAGILRGWESWPERLAEQAASLAALAEKAEHETERSSLLNDARLSEKASSSLRDLFHDIRGLATVRTWREAADTLGKLLSEYAPEQEPHRRDVLAVLSRIACLDVTGVQPELGRVRRLLGGMLRDSNRKVSQFQGVGVTLSSIMRSRGAVYDVVIVPRLLEKLFPLRISPDPILGDGDRIALNRTASALKCGQLPLGMRRPQEERYLFRVALGSARRVVMLCYPRIEQDTGRSRIPSRFIGQACEALCEQTAAGGPVSEAVLEGFVTRVKPAHATGAHDAVDLWEYDLAVHAESGRHQAIGYTRRLSACFARAVRMNQSRWSQRDFGPYDGKLRSPQVAEGLARGHGRPEAPVSASRLETYARCPFEYFMQYELGVEELEKPVEEHEISPPEWGRLVHALLSKVYRTRLKGRRLGEVTEEEMDDVAASASSSLAEIGAVHATGRPAAWAAARDRALALLRMLLRFERQQNGDASPHRFEVAFGMCGGAGGLRVALDGARGITVRGRIDRVDMLPGGAIQVIDYKTGRDTYKEDSLEGGRQLQLPLYLMAAANLLGAAQGRARYLFASEEGQKLKNEFTLADLTRRSGDLTRIIRLIMEGIGAGDFFMAPNEETHVGRHCAEHCAFRYACGQAREKLASIKRGSADMSRLRELGAIK